MLGLTLKDALNIIDTGNWCSIAFVSCDSKRGTAGDNVRIKRARLAAAAASPTGAQAIPAKTALLTGDIRKVKTANGEIRSFHPRLLFAINGRAIL